MTLGPIPFHSYSGSGLWPLSFKRRDAAATFLRRDAATTFISTLIVFPDVLPEPLQGCRAPDNVVEALFLPEPDTASGQMDLMCCE
jgi:hypothetical protein